MSDPQYGDGQGQACPRCNMSGVIIEQKMGLKDGVSFTHQEQRLCDVCGGAGMIVGTNR